MLGVDGEGEVTALIGGGAGLTWILDEVAVEIEENGGVFEWRAGGGAVADNKAAADEITQQVCFLDTDVAVWDNNLT